MGLALQLRLRLDELGLMPRSKLALVAWYLLALDVSLFLLQRLFAVLRVALGQSLGGWVTGLSFAVIILLLILAMRWVEARLLWRLRNRLIVTYVFIGVIPVVLLFALALISFYLFAGQFATFLVTTRLQAELDSLQSATSAISLNLADRLQAVQLRNGELPRSTLLSASGRSGWNVYAWLDGKPLTKSGAASYFPALPASLPSSFCGTVRDNDQLFLRAAQTAMVGGRQLTVVLSEPFDEQMLRTLGPRLGELSLRASGFPGRENDASQVRPLVPPHCFGSDSSSSALKPNPQDLLKLSHSIAPAILAGMNPPPIHWWDSSVRFPTGLFVIDWQSGAEGVPAAMFVQTRLSMLYQRLFESMGDFAEVVEFTMLLFALGLAIIEVAAILIGVGLTRTITAAVALLYKATEHINRGEFNHRIPVKSNDQLATLAKSFNSMTESLEKLIVEQREKQRMEGELVIAQEVQAQLFPRHISQLPTLEVFGFCRPARTVSGDYYDFLALGKDQLLLAVGDISGKGIAAALLMATIHSAVRAYSQEGIPILRESVAAGAGAASSASLTSAFVGPEASPAALLALLNHQLFESTPAEKYATLFLAIYDANQRSLTYSNAGHLPPIILGNDRGIRRLDQGGTVVGLFDDRSYDEAFVHLNRGEIFLAYSDGVTEPENDFGEFGEQRLIELVWDNRGLPLSRISELVTAAVDDWIGDAEQPDDVTLVLARAR